MLKIFFIFVTICCSTYTAKHSWDNPPQFGQRYMTIVEKEKEKVLIITYYRNHTSIKGKNWWDVKSFDILRWFDENNKILYLPTNVDQKFVEKMKDLIK